VVLDAFKTASKDVNVTELRPRLEHAQMLTNTDLQRVGKLGGEYYSFFDVNGSRIDDI
jgi:predicted amidohydrolase YtcJ